MRRLNTLRALKEKNLIVQDNDAALKAVAERYAVGMTAHTVSAVQGPVDCDPVALQYVPQARELVVTPDEVSDPIGDDPHSPVPGIVHRYPDRVLLMPTKTCAVYCRHCFRREKVGLAQDALDAAGLEAALNYIRAHDEIWEVILSGGDPLILSPRRLAEIFAALDDIPHVKIIRLHSKIPVADPARISEALCDVLRAVKKPVYIAIHVNHAQEITNEAEAAFAALHKAGCVLASQSVLLKGVNDNAQALEDLFRRLVELRVKPYYLHHPDKAPGTSHFRVSLAKGQALMKSLRGKMSGLCQPSYVLDIPGGHGKIPVGPVYWQKQNNDRYSVEDIHGCAHDYVSDHD